MGLLGLVNLSLGAFELLTLSTLYSHSHSRSHFHFVVLCLEFIVEPLSLLALFSFHVHGSSSSVILLWLPFGFVPVNLSK